MGLAPPLGGKGSRPGPAPPAPGPSPARARSVRPHSEPRAAAAQVGPAPQRPEMQRGAALCLRLWLWLGLLDGERGEPSARAAGREGGRFPGATGGRAGHWTPGSPGQQKRWGWDPGDTDAGWSPADWVRVRRAEERAGGDCSRVRDRAPSAPQRRNCARGPRPPSTMGGLAPSEPSPAAPRPQLGSFACLLASRGSPGAALLCPPTRAIGTVPRQPRRAADPGAHFPTPPSCARGRSPRGRSGQVSFFPSPEIAEAGVRGPPETGAVGRVGRRCTRELGNLELTTQERSTWQKRQKASAPSI